MKRNALSLLALSAALLVSAVPLVSAQNNAPAAGQRQQKLIKVADLPNAQSIQEFQHNVQVMQAERSAALELKNAMDKEKDDKKKKELKTKLDAALAKLDQDNQTMVKMYNFSLSRNYIMQPETATVWLEVSEDEAAKLEKQAAEQAKQTDAKKGKK